MPASICDLKGATALDALDGMAEVVTAAIQVEQPPEPLLVVYPPDRQDYAVGWLREKWGEPHYWPSYREAIAPLSSREKSAAKRQVLATAMMEEYYLLDMHPLPRNTEDAENARKNLKKQSEVLDALPKDLNAGKIGFAGFCRTAYAVATELERISQYLSGLDPSMAKIPCIAQCVANCKQVTDAITGMSGTITAQEAVLKMEAILGNLRIVRDALSSILNGYSTVTNNESIPGFFLMRLLVGYRIGITRAEDNIFVSIASARLTALLHNQQEWLFDLMQRMIADLAKALQTVGNDICFFLKGGRGMSYLLGEPKKGENDWDTQILINPELPWDAWWQRYGEVRSVVNNRLLRYNFIFSANLMNNAEALIGATDKIAAIVAKDPATYDQLLDSIYTLVWQNALDEQAFAGDQELALASAWQAATRKPSGNCKAELIDVGLPRFCTVELLEQWNHARKGINSFNGIPYPGPAYFIEELIAMVRENDAGASPSPAKRDKRLKRLLSLMSPEVAGFSAFLKEQQDLTGAVGLNATLQRIASISSEPNRDLATVMLGQFCTAYRLAADPNLASAFDNLAADLLGGIMGSNPKSIDQQANSVFEWCQTVSTTMTGHLAMRGQSLLGQVEQIANLLAQIVKAGSTKIAPAIQGGFAISLYRQMTRGEAINNNVAPAEFVDIHLYFQECPSVENITQSMLQELISNLEKFVAQSNYFGAIELNRQANSIKLFAKQPIALAKWSYKPLVIEFRLEAASRLITETGPKLTLMGMRPLISWCRERAAEVSEWAMRQQLSETFGALIEMQALPWQAPSVPMRAKL